MGLKCVTMLIKDGNLSKDEIINSVKSKLSEYKTISSSYEYIAQVINPMSKENFCVVDDELKEALNLDDNIVEFASGGFDNSELNAKIAQLDAKIDNEIVTLSDEILTKASLENHNNLVASLATYALKSDLDTLATKDELLTKANLSDLNTLATKDELSTKADLSNLDNLATKDELRAKADISSLDGLATKDELNNLATKEELNTKANSSDILNLATKTELANLATKEELQEAITSIPTGGGSLDALELQTAITSNETITNLSSVVANLASNMQGATYAQVAAMLNYSSSGASLPKSLAIYSDYSLKERSGDTVVKIKIKECINDSYATLSELKLYGSDGKQYVMHSYTDSSLTSAKLVYKTKDDGVIPEISGVSATSSEWSKGEDEIEVDIKATSAFSAFNAYRIGARFSSSSGWCSAGSAANKDEVTITIKDFTPAKLEIRTGYANNTHLITKSSFVVSAGELYSEELAANEGDKSRVISLDFNKMNLNLNGDKYVELAKAWNIVPSQYEPNYTIGKLSDLIGEVSGDKPFKFTLKGIAIHTDSYGTGITNVEFFNHEGARLYPKYVQVTSGDNVATFILTKNESEKTEVANTIPTDYDYEAANEYKVIAKRISPQYGGNYLFEKMMFYTAAGGYNNEYLTGSGVVHLEFECSFVPAKVQYIQSPYGHGKATGYDILVDDAVVSTVMYAGGSYDYETHDLANVKFRVPKEAAQ